MTLTLFDTYGCNFVTYVFIHANEAFESLNK